MPDASATPTLAATHLREIHESRRNPRITHFLYLHLRHLRADLALALGKLGEPGLDVLDAFCGTRPYEDLLPAGVRYVGFDIDERYGPGVADVVSEEFLPFEDASFDLVLCTQALYYLADPEQGVSEIHRVLRPGGSTVITTPVVWPYHLDALEHRFTEPGLRALFSAWDGVAIVENGGRGTSWATLTGHLLHLAESGISKRLGRSLHLLFAPCYAGINAIGIGLDRLESRALSGTAARLPQNLLLTATRPT